MQVQKRHIHSLALHRGDSVRLVVHSSGKLHPGHMDNGFPQSIREQLRILDQQYRQFVRAHKSDRATMVAPVLRSA
jgi:hypothetical protein